MLDIYTDGGVIGRNPSPIGGTWSFVVVRDGRLFFEDSGIVTPETVGLDEVTNNMTELIAVMNAVEWSRQWPTTIYTDSLISLYRLSKKKSKFAGIPDPIRLRFLQVRSEHTKLFTPILVKGHPTKADLRRGRTQSGVPVSLWNVRADRLCCQQAEQFVSPKKEACVAEST
jgi:ribonuclease HI